MAQKWHEKASVQASIVNAIIGVLPATAVAIVAIWVQIDLAKQQADLNKQTSLQQAKKDSLDSIRSARQYSADSLLAVQQLALNKLQVELAGSKRKDDIEPYNRMERISKNELRISESQFSIQRVQLKEKEVNDFISLEIAVSDIYEITNQFRPYSGIYFKEYDGRARKIVRIMSQQLANPALQKNKELFSSWVVSLAQLNELIFIYNILEFIPIK